jgi:CO dehydrogenase maturation factor
MVKGNPNLSPPARWGKCPMHLVQDSSLRLAVVGKGGAGKSVIAGTLARVLARRGLKVLVLDSDMLPGLALSLGTDQPDPPPLIDAAEQDENGRWRLKKGIGPVRAVERYSTAAPDGVRLLSAGKAAVEGLGPIMGALNAYYEVIHRLHQAKAFRDWTLLGDLPAGPRQTAFGWAPFADNFLIVVEPEWKSILTARRIARIASMREGVTVSAVANKVSGQADLDLISGRLDAPIFAAVPADDAVHDAECHGKALIDAAPDSPAVRGVEQLADNLDSLGRGDTLGT